MDPNLLTPGADPSTAGLRANPLARPTEVAPHPFLGTTIVPNMAYYYNSVPGASMHRPDGKKLAFMFNLCATNIKQDIEYFEKEIADGHGYVRHATKEEVHLYKMRTDPRGTMTDELRPQIEAELREKLEAEIKARLMGELTAGMHPELLSGVDRSGEAGKTVQSGTAKVTITADREPVKVPLTPAQQLAALAVAKQNAQRPPITPVSTADLGGAQAGSTGNQ